MNKLFVYFFISLLLISDVYSNNYFIRLTQTGVNHRDDLINNKLNNIPGLKTFHFKKPANLLTASIINNIKYKDTFNHWLTVSIEESESVTFFNKLKSENVIDFYEEAGAFKVEPLTNDSLLSKQWYINKIDLALAWDVTKGSEDIIIGVIDTGIDYNHPDLQSSIWINAVEDLNHNGKLDSTDINGIDDDQNGFIDDVIGWDFTDAPRFADDGDYKDPDNDPMDEFGAGHGTQVAGIIAAQSNNTIGITGIAPQVKVMNLRSGTASGYLEEDDVANAIIYALDNGAKIINMSFGDVALSRFLKDVIYFAYQNGLIMIASSGNSASDEIHYPSGLAETISVGASTEDDNLAGFSNFGSTIDLVAPGVNIISAAVGGGYNSVNGTSFSAPVVSAVSGLILSVHPQYSAERMRNLLKTSTTDILYYGWDIYSGAGRVSAGKALSVENSGILQLIEPAANSSTALDTLWLIGTILHPDIVHAQVDYGYGGNPENWITINEYQNRQVLSDTLGFINIKPVSDTLLTIRLKMTLLDGSGDEQRNIISIDRTKPQINHVQLIPLFDGQEKAQLITFETDDICMANIYLLEEGQSDFDQIIELGYETCNHRLKLNQSSFEGAYQFYIKVKNYSGLISIDNNGGAYYSFEIKPEFTWKEFIRVDWELPSGYLLNKAVDLDFDGNKEIILSRYNENNGFGPVEIYEFENDHFIKRLETSFTAIPRDAGDVDGDGLGDLLLGYGQLSFLFESVKTDTFPTELIWSDSAEFWAAGYADLDGDGKGEIVGRVDSQYVIFEHNGQNTFSETGRLNNCSSGANQFGAPKIELVDINGDQKQDLIFGDYDGDLMVYTADGDNQFELLTLAQTIHTDATEMLSGLDIPGEKGLFFAGSHISDDISYEHEFDARYRTVEQFEYNNEQKTYVSINTINIYGYHSTKEYDSGIKITGFGEDNYLFAAFYPNIYIFKVDENNLQPVWHYANARSNAIIIDDFDGDGVNEFYYNNGDKIIGFTKTSANRPAAPYPFTANPLDSNQIYLKWGASAGVEYYNIYRGNESDNLQKIAPAIQNVYLDSVLNIEQFYYYAVTAVDSTFAIQESPLSKIDSAKTSIPPCLIKAETENNRQLILYFNEKVQFLNTAPKEIHTKLQEQYAASALIMPDQTKILVGFSEPFFSEIIDTIFAGNIFDLAGVAVDQNYNSAAFCYEKPNSEPYLQKVDIVNRYCIHLYFSEPMQENSLSNQDNYQLHPSGGVEEIKILDSLNTQVELILNKKSFAGSFGKPCYLVLQNLISADGVLLRETDKINLFKQELNLENILIYPQPVKPQHNEVIFAKLPKNVEIRVFNINGKLIKILDGKTIFGGIHWDLKDSNKNAVRSGVYIYEIIHNNEKKYGKLVIVR